MYTFSSRLKTFSFILMILGVLGIGYGFFTAPKTVADVEKILAEDSHHDGHGNAAHHDAHGADKHLDNDDSKGHDGHGKAGHDAATEGGHVNNDVELSAPAATNAGMEESGRDREATEETTVAHGEASDAGQTTQESQMPDVHNDDATDYTIHDKDDIGETAKKHVTGQGHDDAAVSHEEHQEHLEHVLHQLQNKPWAAVYVAALFFMLISLGVLVFYAIQWAAQAGWSPVLFRVMEGITSYLLPGSVIVFILLVAGVMHWHHLFIWMDEDVVAADRLLQNKSGYLDPVFFLIRAAVFIFGWNLYRYFARRNSLANDDANNDGLYKKTFKMSAGFLVFFIVTESIMSWDWIMSVDPHWFSTLFGWYVFASFFVSGITTIAMVTIYLKGKGYLEFVNTSHLHDLAKFMFGISVFWTYLWFSQFMLIWYANIPEEVTYFVTRIEQYNLPFFGMLALNFIFPILILLNTDFKRLSWIVVLAGVLILCGHYIDFFNMIMPATVGDQWFIGAAEIGSIFFFFGLFIFIVFTSLSKVPLMLKRNPYIEESKHFHY